MAKNRSTRLAQEELVGMKCRKTRFLRSIQPGTLGRREALPGVRLCVECQSERDRHAVSHAGYNRRGSKDSQLR